MADPRKFRGVRLSPQGDAYVQLVAARDRTDFSKALRYLLALGARADMEAQDGAERTNDRSGPRDHVDHQREAVGVGRDRDSDGGAGSGSVPSVPDSGHEDGRASEGSIGSALGNLIQGGFRPEAADPDTPGAA